MKSLNLSNEIDEFKKVESIFWKNQLNDLIIDKLRGIMQLKNNINLDDIEYTAKRGKRYNNKSYNSKYSLRIVF